MSYELWDTETGNLVDAFDNDAEALRAAGELMTLNPDVYPEMLTLLSVSDRGELATVAAGGELGTLVQSALDGGVRRTR